MRLTNAWRESGIDDPLDLSGHTKEARRRRKSLNFHPVSLDFSEKKRARKGKKWEEKSLL